VRPRTETSPWNGRRVKQLCVTIDPETMAEINQAAERDGLTRSEWVRERLEWALMEADDKP
jgi:predicted DNA-binding protein